MAATVPLKLQCRLEVLHPLADERYTVQFSWSRDVPSGGMIQNVEVEAATFNVDDLRMPILPHPPRTLNVKLFSFAVHENVPVELCIGSAYMATTEVAVSNTNVLFVNTSNEQQGRLVVSCTNPPLDLLQAIPAEYHDKDDQSYSQSLIVACRGKYQRREVRTNSRQVFFSISTDNGFLPTVCFPILATLTPKPMTDRQSAFLVRLLLVAQQLRGVAGQPLDSLSNAELLEVINEMVCSVTKALVYTPDRTRGAGKSGPVFNEQWERVSTFPHRALAGYDCEDCCQWILEIAYALRDPDNAPQLPAVLEPVSRMLQRMTLFTVEGDLDADGGWTAHCYALALDSNYVDYLLQLGPPTPVERQSAYLPSVVLEGTSWIQGVWSGGARKRCARRASALEKYGAKVYVAEDPTPYGPVAQMQTADHRGHAVTLAMVRGGVMGVPLTELVFQQAEPTDVQMWTDTDAEDMPKLLDELVELPLTCIPGWSDGVGVDPGAGAVVMRWVDWESLQGTVPGLATRVQLSDDGLCFALVRQ